MKHLGFAFKRVAVVIHNVQVMLSNVLNILLVLLVRLIAAA